MLLYHCNLQVVLISNLAGCIIGKKGLVYYFIYSNIYPRSEPQPHSLDRILCACSCRIVLPHVISFLIYLFYSQPNQLEVVIVVIHLEMFVFIVEVSLI